MLLGPAVDARLEEAIGTHGQGIVLLGGGSGNGVCLGAQGLAEENTEVTNATTFPKLSTPSISKVGQWRVLTFRECPPSYRDQRRFAPRASMRSGQRTT